MQGSLKWISVRREKKNVFHDRDWEKALGEGNQAH